jgi:PAS domain S-box-containing protein
MVGVMVVAPSDTPVIELAERQPNPTAGVIIADPDLLVIHVEGTVFARHGYTGADWPGRPLGEMLPAASWLELEPRYRAALSGEHQVFDYQSNDGRSTYWVQITPIRDEVGVVTSVVAVMQDVTESLTMTRDLSRSEERLGESERMVGVGSGSRRPAC